MFTFQLYRADALQNSTAVSNHWNLTHKGVYPTQTSYEVPISAIILLCFLTFSLIFLAVMYLILSRMKSKVMDKLLISRETRNLISDDTRDFDEDDEWSLQVDNAKLLQGTNKAVARLQVSVSFSEVTGRIAVNIVQVTEVAAEVLQHRVANAVQIHAKMQPLAKKFRYRTLSKPIGKAVFNEQFAFDGFRRQDLRKCWFRFRLYTAARFGKDRILGQVTVGVMDFEEDGIWGTLWLNMTPSEDISKLISSTKELNTY